MKKHLLSWLTLLLIASVAILLRVYAIDRLPPGLFGDEAVEGLDALDVWVGNFQIWFHAGLGREPLFVYLVALSYRAFGVTPLATRLPALIAGLVTIPATFFFVREWAMRAFSQASRERVARLALLTSVLLAISFWHMQMSRNAHRDILLPLVEATGYTLLWRAIRTGHWKMYAGAGALLGLAIYTYSPGRFVGVFIAVFCAVEFLIAKFGRRASEKILAIDLDLRGLAATAIFAILMMLPLGIYFAQNPVQFSRRFESVSIFSADVPAAALVSSVSGNLAMFGIPGAGYQSKHYNLPGRPVFDLFLLPWFLAGILIAVARSKNSAYRFLLLWFLVMMMPAFLTADMIPKGVRSLGVVPGILVFPVLAMDLLLERTRGLWRRAAILLIAISFIGSAAWAAYDYFVSWANLPELPLAFDADMVEVSDFINRQPADQPIYVSAEVYRHPTLMLLGKRIPTTQYFDRATRIKEFDSRDCFVVRASNPLYLFVQADAPADTWFTRAAPRAQPVAQGKFFSAFATPTIAPPEQWLDLAFSPLLKLVAYSRFTDEPRGIALYWLVTDLPADRLDMEATLTLLDARGIAINEQKKRFCYPPFEWGYGETVIDWYEMDLPGDATQFTVRLSRGTSLWQSPLVSLK